MLEKIGYVHHSHVMAQEASCSPNVTNVIVRIGLVVAMSQDESVMSKCHIVIESFTSTLIRSYSYQQNLLFYGY